MTDTSKATPRLKVEPCGYCTARDQKCDDYQITGPDAKRGGRLTKAHAEFVVTAVNAYDAMRDALRLIVDNNEAHSGHGRADCACTDTAAIARAALAAAEGKGE